MSSNGPAKEVTSYKIFVGGLDLDTTEEDLTEYFSKFGKVVERLIKVDIKTKRSRGFGFIGFKSPESVDRVLEIKEHRIKGRKIDCKKAMTKEEAYSLNKNLANSCRKVFISNIPKEVTKAEVFDFISKFGKVLEVNLMFKKKDTGFCYVIFESEEDAISLLEQKAIEYKGQILEIKKAVPKDIKESPEEESRGRVPTQQFTASPLDCQRNSFDNQASYHSPYYSTQNVPVMGNPQYHKMSHFTYYEGSPAQNPNIIGHRMSETMPVYDRSAHGPHPHMPQGEDYRYGSKQFYPSLVGAYPNSNANSLGVELQPHRNRVRSEQQINTYKQFSVIPPTGPVYYQGNEMRHLVNRSKFAGHSYSHAEELLQYHQVDITENHKVQKNAQSRHGTPNHEFIENPFNFKSQFPKDNAASQGSGGKPHKNSKGSMNEDKSSKQDQKTSSDMKQEKLIKIMALEDEILGVKGKLKMLEGLLTKYREEYAKEYEVVEEEKSVHERNSDSLNNE